MSLVRDVEVVQLSAGTGRGPVWGTASADLNATLLSWPPGHEVPGHVNADRDVAYVVVAGSAELVIEEVRHALEAPALVIVPAGSSRALRAGPEGVRYVTLHRVRGGLQIAPPPTPG